MQPVAAGRSDHPLRRGLGLGASSLLLLTITGVGGSDPGAASGIVNTVVQLGLAAGPATIGTLYFGRLHLGSTDATTASLFLGLALFAVALMVCLLLPGPVAMVSAPIAT